MSPGGKDGGGKNLFVVKERPAARKSRISILQSWDKNRGMEELISMSFRAICDQMSAVERNWITRLAIVAAKCSSKRSPGGTISSLENPLRGLPSGRAKDQGVEIVYCGQRV